MSLAPPFERTHLEQVTDHFKNLECGEAITFPSGHLRRPCHRSLLDFEWTLLYYPYSSHSGNHRSASSVSPRLTSLLLWVCNSQPRNHPFAAGLSAVLSAHQGAVVFVICRSRGDRKMEAETGERIA